MWSASLCVMQNRRVLVPRSPKLATFPQPVTSHRLRVQRNRVTFPPPPFLPSLASPRPPNPSPGLNHAGSSAHAKDVTVCDTGLKRGRAMGGKEGRKEVSTYVSARHGCTVPSQTQMLNAATSKIRATAAILRDHACCFCRAAPEVCRSAK